MLRIAVLLHAFWQLIPLSEARESTLDFGLIDVITEPSTEQVVIGRVLLYGQVSIEMREELALAARAALSVVCSPRTGDHMGMSMPVTTYVFQDILTFNSARIGLHIEFHMLAPIGGGISCVDRLSSMSVGAPEPPFEPIPAPAFRTLLTWELSQSRLTQDLDISDWRVEVVNITCDELHVLRPVQFPDAGPPPSLTSNLPQRHCDGGIMPEVDWAALEASAWQSAAGKCELAPTPCVCSAVAGCSWNAGQCREGDHVACEHCALRPGCEPTSAELCAAARTPCSCVASAGNCIWEDNICKVRLEPNTDTSCYACMRQPRCPPVQVDRLTPARLSFMGLREVGWFVNVTFNRQVWFTHAAAGSVVLQCPRSNGQMTQLQVAAEALAMVDLTLTVDVRSVTNDLERDCDLLISAGALRDRDHVEFLGMDARFYTITLPDTAPPVLQSFEPANSAVDVGLTEPVTFTFDEAMSAGPVEGAVLLLALGADRPDEGREADVEVARFRVGGPEVSFDGRHVVVATNSVTLQADTLYSLSVPPGVLADRHGNAFAGLAPAVYAFRTADEDLRVVKNGGEYSLSGEFVIGSIVVGAALLGIVIMSGFMCMRMHSMRQKVLSHGDSVHLNAPDPAAVQWGGERVVFGNSVPQMASSVSSADFKQGGSVSGGFDEWQRGVSPGGVGYRLSGSVSSMDTKPHATSAGSFGNKPRAGSLSSLDGQWGSMSNIDPNHHGRGATSSQDKGSSAGSMESAAKRGPRSPVPLQPQPPGRREAWEGAPRADPVGRRSSSASAPEEVA